MKETNTQNKERNIKADVIRGFAIITVIIGHCIQNGNGWYYFIDGAYWGNKVYQFIYSFHMPLFMLLAGWFAYYSIKKVEGDRKAQWKLLGKRAFTYITPIFLWTLFEFARGEIMRVSQGEAPTAFGTLFAWFVTYFLTNLWFLWAILICLIIVFVMHLYLEDNVPLYVLGFCSFYILPDAANLGVYKYLIPYYIAAFYMNMCLDRFANREEPENKDEEESIGNRIYSIISKLITSYKSKPNMYLIISAVVFAILFIFYNSQTFIYVSGYRVSRTGFIKKVILDTYRMVIGFAGSTFFMILWDRIIEHFKGCKWRLLTAFGRNSLGIYILQGYYILIVMASYTNNLTWIKWYHIPIEVVIISTVSLITAMILGKIPVIKILVGKL